MKRLASIALLAAVAILPAVAQAGQNGNSNQNYPTNNNPAVNDNMEPTPPHDPQYDYWYRRTAPGQEQYVVPAAPDNSDDSNP